MMEISLGQQVYADRLMPSPRNQHKKGGSSCSFLFCLLKLKECIHVPNEKEGVLYAMVQRW